MSGPPRFVAVTVDVDTGALIGISAVTFDDEITARRWLDGMKALDAECGGTWRTATPFDDRTLLATWAIRPCTPDGEPLP